MNPDLFKEVIDFISENEYPTLATKGERFVIKRRAANYILQDGELYYIKNKGTAKELRLKVLCGSEAADQVFQEFHCSSFGAHCGQIKTRDAICKRNYWPGMTLDIDGWFAEKVLCNETADQIEFPSSKEDLDKYRKEIAHTVLEETDDLSEMCLYCGLQDGTKPKSSKHDSTVNWIQCEHCCRWFHQECVGNEEDFLCPACTYCNL